MAVRTFAPRTFRARTFIPLRSTGGLVVVSPVAPLILPVRPYRIDLPLRDYTVTLVARAPQLTLPPRVFAITLPPRGQGGAVALSLPKQPAETFFYTVFGAQYLPAGRTIASVQSFASRKNTTVADALTAQALADATSILISNNPGKGARILVNGLGATAELVKASAVSGSSPCTVTVIPALMFQHEASEAVTYEPGFSASVLVSTAPVTTSTDFSPHVTRGIHTHTYRMSHVITLDNGDVIEAENDLICEDV